MGAAISNACRRLTRCRRLLVVGVAVMGTTIVAGCGGSGGSSSTSAQGGSTAQATGDQATVTSQGNTKDPGVINDRSAELGAVPKPKRPYRIFLLQAHRDDPFSVSTTKAAEQFGKQHGVRVTVKAAAAYNDVQGQIAQIEAAITQKPDAILIWATDPQGIVPALKRAEAAGITVINWVIPSALPVPTVGSDYVKDGYVMANALFQKMGGSGEFVSILGGASSSYAADLHKGMEKAKAQYPDVKLVEDATIKDFDQAAVQSKVENYLLGHPDLKGVFTTTSLMAIGAYQAAQAAGKAGDVITVGELIQDCAPIELMKAGKLPIIVGSPAVFLSDLGIATAIRALNGEDIPDKQVPANNVYTPQNIDRAASSGALDEEVDHSFIDACAK